MSDFSTGTSTRMSSPEVSYAVNEITRVIQKHLIVNDFFHLLVGSALSPASDRDSRLAIERLSQDAWSLELILSKPFGARTIGLPSFFGWLEPDEENWGRRLVGPHKTFMEATQEGLAGSVLEAVELMTLYEQLFDDVKISFLEDSKSLDEEFAKELRRIARSRSTVGGFSKAKVRNSLTKDSGNWREALPNLFPESEFHVVRESLAVTKTYALMATFDSSGLPRTIYYIQNTGGKFKSRSVFRWNGQDFVPTNSQMFSGFSLQGTYSTNRSHGPDFISVEMLNFFFPEVSARLGLYPNGSAGDCND